MSPVPDTAVKVRGVLKLCSSYDRMFYIDVKNFIIADDFLVFSKDSHRYKEMLVWRTLWYKLFTHMNSLT